MDNTLTTKDRWESTWANIRLPYITIPDYDIREQLESRLPRANEYSLVEIGCAPGGWMAWFNGTFGYSVSGVEYAEDAASITRKNLDIQAVRSEIIVHDFLTLDTGRCKYDIVFSAGFIEHFRDVAPVVQRICSLSRRYVITIVPNVYGINGAIRQCFNPAGYAEHTPLDPFMLDRLHTSCGMRTLFCDYVGGIAFIRPGAGRRFIRDHRHCARVIHAPVIALNHMSLCLGRTLKYTPRSKMFSARMMYIGEKSEE